VSIADPLERRPRGSAEAYAWSTGWETPRVTIAEFIAARLNEDEALAKAADRSGWIPQDEGLAFEGPDTDGDGGQLSADTRVNQEHIARWDPERVLAEVYAKRQIGAQHDELIPHAPDPRTNRIQHYCRTCSAVDDQDYFTCATIRLLALPFASHPDYREEWRPTGNRVT
jgi:hypothetical protein